MSLPRLITDKIKQAIEQKSSLPIFRVLDIRVLEDGREVSSSGRVYVDGNRREIRWGEKYTFKFDELPNISELSPSQIGALMSDVNNGVLNELAYQHAARLGYTQIHEMMSIRTDELGYRSTVADLEQFFRIVRVSDERVNGRVAEDSAASYSGTAGDAATIDGDEADHRLTCGM